MKKQSDKIKPTGKKKMLRMADAVRAVSIKKVILKDKSSEQIREELQAYGVDLPERFDFARTVSITVHDGKIVCLEKADPLSEAEKEAYVRARFEDTNNDLMEGDEFWQELDRLDADER